MQIPLQGVRTGPWLKREAVGGEELPGSVTAVGTLPLPSGRLPGTGSIQGDQAQLPTPALPLFRSPLPTLVAGFALTPLAPFPSAERGVKENVSPRRLRVSF